MGCRTSPSACVAAVGKEVASTAAVVKLALDAKTEADVVEELEACADKARSEVLLRHAGDFAGPSPSAEECRQPAKNAREKNVTWAMQLGTEMHEVAQTCAQAALEKLLPGRFSLEQRYLYNRQTRVKKPVSAEEERLLKETGNLGELKGSVKPDVVIHTGDLLRVLAIYDFKFPCVNPKRPPSWNSYSDGRPYQNINQGELYEEVFDVVPKQIYPRWGAIR